MIYIKSNDNSDVFICKSEIEGVIQTNKGSKIFLKSGRSITTTARIEIIFEAITGKKPK